MTTPDPLIDFATQLEDAKSLPVLFVGSGLSMRYLKTPVWDDLLAEFAAKAGASLPDYRGKSSSGNPGIASLVAEDFYDVWWKQRKYAASRTAFQDHVVDRADPLKYEITKYLGTFTTPKRGPLKRELAALAKVRVQSIITTNWDELLEQTLPQLEVYVGQSEILFANTQEVGEVYKIHGSLAQPRSLILTDEDYADYWDRNPYLVAKILTLFVEHPVVFAGYSLQDPHIQRLLTNLLRCLKPEQVARLNRRLFFMRRATVGTPVELRPARLPLGAYQLEVQELVVPDFGDAWDVLAALPQTFPVEVLRRLKQSVYELAYTTTPKGQVFVVGLEDDSDLDKLEVVIGVGTMARLGEKGYVGLDRHDLFVDMLVSKRHDPDGLVQHVLPVAFRQAKYSPVFYPLDLAGRVDDVGAVADRSGLPAHAVKLLDNPPKPYVKVPDERKNKTFRELLAMNVDLVWDAGLVCEYEVEDVVALKHFLHDRFESIDGAPTSVAKLGCKFDKLVYGREFSGDRAALLEALKAPTATP